MPESPAERFVTMAEETLTTFEGWYKDRYGGPEYPLPDTRILLKDIPFSTRELVGNNYVQGIRLRRPNGWTFGTAGTAYPLNTPVPGKTDSTSVAGTSFTNWIHLAYDVISRGKTSQQAFNDTFDEIVYEEEVSSTTAAELFTLYGGSHMGAIATETDGTTTSVLTITAATWAPGIWAQMEGMPVDIWDPTFTTQRNTDADIIVQDMTVSTRTVNISGDETDLNAIAVGDVIVPKGVVGVWGEGLKRMCSVTSGTFHGISATTYGAWRPTTSSAGLAAATMNTFTENAAHASFRMGRGDQLYYISMYTWTDFLNDSAALRRFTESQKSGIDFGTEDVVFYGPNGKITFKPHPMVMAGEALGVRPEYLKRIGSSDLTWNLGMDGQNPRFFQELAGQAGCAMRNYFDFAPYTGKRISLSYINNIVNNSLA